MLEEVRVLRSVEVLVEQQAANVLWENRIVKDGIIVAATPHRCSYTQEQKEQFIVEVTGAENYITVLGWA